MRKLVRRALLVLCVAALAAAGGWAAWHWTALVRQYHVYRVGAATGAADAARELVWFDAEPQRSEKLRELCAAWGQGHPRFDDYLAQHVYSAQAGDALREAFALEFARRPGLVTRWAHWWHWRHGERAAEEIDSLKDYLATLASQSPPRAITWRDVLDLQAAMALTGQPQLAQRLKPSSDVWPDRYRRWLAVEARWLTLPKAPPQPLPD